MLHHAAQRIDKSTGEFHQCLGWPENRGLCTNFRTSLFGSYVLPSLLDGSEFSDEPSVRLLDRKMRQFGRRLLMWPRGAPGAAVVGELGWCPLSVEVRR